MTPGWYVQSSPGEKEQSPAGDHGQIIFEQEADPWICYITKVTDVRDLKAWIFDLECGGEGEIWQQRSIVMHTSNPAGIAAYNLGIDPVIQLYRCTP